MQTSQLTSVLKVAFPYRLSKIKHISNSKATPYEKFNEMKKLIGTLGIAAIALSMTFSTASATATLAEISLDGPKGCTTTPGENTGQCKQNVNGTEYNCVSSSWTKDCSGD